MIRHHSPISGIDTFKTQFVATAGYDNQVILWDAASRRPLARSYHDHLANQCRFSSCGRYLITSSSDYTARLWSIPGLKLLAVFSDHNDDVEMSVIDQAGERVATASRDGRIRVFDIGGGLLRRIEGHEADVISVEWLDGKNELISSSDDGTVKHWDAGTGRLIRNIPMDGVETDTVAIGPAGTIYAGNDSGEIVEISSGAVRKTFAHAAGIKRLAYHRGRNALVSLSYDRKVKLWDCATMAMLREAAFPACIWPRSCAFEGDGRLVFGTFGTTYAAYDYQKDTWEVAGVEETPGVNAVVERDGVQLTVGDAGIVRISGREAARLGSCCNFLLSCGPLVLTGGQMGQVFDALTGRMLHQHSSPLNCGVAFERAGALNVLVGTYTGEGLLFRVGDEGGLTFLKAAPLNENAIKGVACDGSKLFSVSATGASAYHSLDDLSCLERFEAAHAKIANGCAVLPDGRFASVSRDLKLRLWSGERCQVIATPHTHSIKCVAVAPRSGLIATGSYNGAVAVYDPAREIWETLKPSAAGISSLCPRGDGQGFWASSYDGLLHRIA